MSDNRLTKENLEAAIQVMRQARDSRGRLLVLVPPTARTYEDFCRYVLDPTLEEYEAFVNKYGKSRCRAYVIEQEEEG